MRFGFLGEGSGRPFLSSPRAVAAAAILHTARNSRFSRAQLVMNRGPGPVAAGGRAARGGESRGVLISIKLIDKLGMSWCPVPAACRDARAMIKIDIHQHLWTEPLVQALAERRELPFVRREHGLTVLFLAGERPYVIDLSAEAPARRAALVELDGLDRALLCLSSPLGIESLPREHASPDRRLPRRGPFARRSLRRVGCHRARPPGPRRRRARHRPRLRGAFAPRRRATQRRCPFPPALGTGAP